MKDASVCLDRVFPFELSALMTGKAHSFFTCNTTILGISTIFFALVLGFILPSFRHLFLDDRGWTHRFFGGIHFLLLLLGALICWIEVTASTHGGKESESIFFATLKLISSNTIVITLLYDILLGCSGVVTTLTAARDFPHRLVRNKPGQSGSLHREAIVTQAEMIEHSFYQGLNLIQAIYLHAISHLKSNSEIESKIEATAASVLGISPSMATVAPRILCLWVVTTPWYLRHRFPVHGFSRNWSKGSRLSTQNTTETTNKTISTSNENRRKQQQDEKEKSNVSDRGGEIMLYRIKKAQYLFYKHVILHGLNISVALGERGTSPVTTSLHDASTNRHNIPYGIQWRIFWLLLNTSYVMEFFLQTLVKRKVLSQTQMIILQKLLMIAASLSAISVLFGKQSERNSLVRPEFCLISLALNFAHRHHDVSNTIGIALAFWLLEAWI